MTEPWPIDLETLSLTETIRLQNKLSEMVAKRFEKRLAVVFSDIVASTQYFARFGDEAGHRLQQQHFDLLTEACGASEGHIMHTAGDGAMLSFPDVPHATQGLIGFHRNLRTLNWKLPPEQQWRTRTALHWGTVITDGTILVGDTVNMCAKACASAPPGKICLTRSAYAELDSRLRSVCSLVTLPPDSINAGELWSLCPQELLHLPTHFIIEETREEQELPDQPLIRVGRLRDVDGLPANDIVLQLTDAQLTNQISRWHIELHRHPDGYMVHSVSDKPTEVDGCLVGKGQQRVIRLNSTVRLSHVLTLRFLNRGSSEAGDATVIAFTNPQRI